MPLYDFHCDKCNITEEHLVREDVDFCCLKCKKIMTRKFPNTMDFRLIYDPKKHKVSWSAEGFASTQRYKNFKKKLF